MNEKQIGWDDAAKCRPDNQIDAEKVRVEPVRAWAWSNPISGIQCGTVSTDKGYCEELKASSKWSQDMMTDLIEVLITPVSPKSDDKEVENQELTDKVRELQFDNKELQAQVTQLKEENEMIKKHDEYARNLSSHIVMQAEVDRLRSALNWISDVAQALKSDQYIKSSIYDQYQGIIDHCMEALTELHNLKSNYVLQEPVGEKNHEKEITLSPDCESSVIKSLRKERNNLMDMNSALMYENTRLREAIKNTLSHIAALSNPKYCTIERIGLIIERLEGSLFPMGEKGDSNDRSQSFPKDHLTSSKERIAYLEDENGRLKSAIKEICKIAFGPAGNRANREMLEIGEIALGFIKLESTKGDV